MIGLFILGSRKLSNAPVLESVHRAIQTLVPEYKNQPKQIKVTQFT